MADDHDARIVQLEAELAALREQQQADRAESIAFRARLEGREYALAKAEAQQRVTAELLRLLASPTDLQSVLDSVVQSAVRVLSSRTAALRTVEGDGLRVVARANADLIEILGASGRSLDPLSLRTTSTRAFTERRTVYVPDRSDPAILRE